MEPDTGFSAPSDLHHDRRGADGPRLAWKKDHLRRWDLLQLITPWLLLTVSTAIYFAWELPGSGEAFWPRGATVLSIVAVTALWIFVGHTRPIRNHTLRPSSTAICFVGVLAMGAVLLSYSDAFTIFVIAGFFHAYLLHPWQVGILGVFATSIILNGFAMDVWAGPTVRGFAEFALIVFVQTAAIGIGILLSARSEPEERRREELVDRLETALYENAGLHSQLVVQARESGILDERQRLAREIHDTLAQGLAGIITQLQAAERSAGTADGPSEHIGQALTLARHSLSEARRSVQALGPGELGSAQLPDALRTLTDQWSAQQGHVAQLDVTGTSVPLSPAIEVSLFRVVQESLTNVAKHANASRVRVTLSYIGSEVLLDVRDDGRGFVENVGTGFGLISMRQRIRGVGGHIDIETAPGEGTSISVRVPAIVSGGAGDKEAEQ